ncbi:MAG: hypothetical protein IJE21_03355 [Alistipes sp.]|nr:hypothetical protein [Alistipes sp.]
MQTGHIHLRRCLFLAGYTEVCYDGKSWVRTNELSDGGAIIRPTAKVHAVRVVATTRSDAENNVVIGPLRIR